MDQFDTLAEERAIQLAYSTLDYMIRHSKRSADIPMFTTILSGLKAMEAQKQRYADDVLYLRQEFASVVDCGVQLSKAIEISRQRSWWKKFLLWIRPARRKKDRKPGKWDDPRRR